MALIKCPECGKEISDSLERCIHCGYALDQMRPEAVTGSQKETNTAEDMKKQIRDFCESKKKFFGFMKMGTSIIYIPFAVIAIIAVWIVWSWFSGNQTTDISGLKMLSDLNICIICLGCVVVLAACYGSVENLVAVKTFVKWMKEENFDYKGYLYKYGRTLHTYESRDYNQVNCYWAARYLDDPGCRKWFIIRIVVLAAVVTTAVVCTGIFLNQIFADVVTYKIAVDFAEAIGGSTASIHFKVTNGFGTIIAGVILFILFVVLLLALPGEPGNDFNKWLDKKK